MERHLRSSAQRTLPTSRSPRPTFRLAVLGALVAALCTAGTISAAAVVPEPLVSSHLTYRTFTPPSSITDDCSHDVADPLRAWLYSLPTGTSTNPVVVVFAPGGCYLVNESLFLRSFNDVVFDGNGATFRQATPTTESMLMASGVTPYSGTSYMPFYASFYLPIAPIIWYFDGGSDITIEDMTIDGPNVSQKSTSGGGTMVDSGIELDGVQRAVIRDNNIEHVDGDFVTLMGLLDAPTANWSYPTTDVTIADNSFQMSGRQGITPESVNRVSITGNTFSNVGATAIDMESGVIGGCACDVSVDSNVFSTTAPFLVSAITGSAITRFAFTDNTLNQGAQLRVELAPALPSSAITIAHNTGSAAAAWPYQSVFIGHGPYGDSAGTMTGVYIGSNTLPDNLYGPSFTYSGQNVSGLAIRNNVLSASRPLVPLQMDGNQTQGYSCGNTTTVGGSPVDGQCAGYVAPALPIAPLVPSDSGIITVNHPPLAITSSGLGSLTVATPYSATLQASGASGAVNWSVTGGSLPSGLHLTSAGTLTGTPTTPGSSTFTVSATDGDGDTSTELFSVAVSPLNATATSPVSSIASTPDGGGYWLTDWTGQVLTRGDAGYFGSMAGTHLNAPITHIVPTLDGHGYWLVAGDGGIFSFGDAPFFGSMGGQHLNAPVVDLAPTADGGGYWLVATDGGIFSFGDARFQGSMGGHHLNQPIVGLATDAGHRGLLAGGQRRRRVQLRCSLPRFDGRNTSP